MVRSIIIFSLILIMTLVSTGQSISEQDSLQIALEMQEILKGSATKEFHEFKMISARKISCLICEKGNMSKSEPFLFNRKDFFYKHLNKIINYEIWKRAQNSNEIIYFKEPSVNERYSDITVLITIWKENEYAVGHEGSQLGLYFKEINGKYRFAGLETIP
jgi:hypothetical protein